MSKMNIRTICGEYVADLDDSDISNAVWLSLPFRGFTNMLGDEIYFEMPLDPLLGGEPQTVFEKGDIAWWPKVNALCIFFGPTPLSGEDGRPVSKFPLIKIGKLITECSDMENAGDRQPISLEKAF